MVDGKYTGDLDFYAYGPRKAAAIQALAEELGVDLQGSYAYSDSATDLPMLDVVGNPVAVNPDKALRRIAMDREWTIEVFRNPVTLRDRLPQLRAPELNPAGALAAAVGVAGIAVATWWITKKSTRRSG
jgi:haloacid dehalogenase-like hydrolase